MKFLKFTALFFFDLAAFLGAVYDILDERREMRKLKRILEDCRKYAELDNYSPTAQNDEIGNSKNQTSFNYTVFDTRMSNDEWADAVIEELSRKMGSHD